MGAGGLLAQRAEGHGGLDHIGGGRASGHGVVGSSAAAAQLGRSGAPQAAGRKGVASGVTIIAVEYAVRGKELRAIGVMSKEVRAIEAERVHHIAMGGLARVTGMGGIRALSRKHSQEPLRVLCGQ